jgi:hypothetical protein
MVPFLRMLRYSLFFECKVSRYYIYIYIYRIFPQPHSFGGLFCLLWRLVRHHGNVPIRDRTQVGWAATADANHRGASLLATLVAHTGTGDREGIHVCYIPGEELVCEGMHHPFQSQTERNLL